MVFDLYLCFAAHFVFFRACGVLFFFCSRQPHFTWQLVVGGPAYVLNLSPALFLDRRFVSAIMGAEISDFLAQSVVYRQLPESSNFRETNLFVQLIYTDHRRPSAKHVP